MENQNEQSRYGGGPFRAQGRPERPVELEYSFIEPDAKTSLKTRKVRVRDPESGEIVEAYITEKTEFDELYDKLEPLGNLTFAETETAKMYKTMGNFLQYITEEWDIDLSPAQRYMVREGKSVAHVTKSREGWLFNTMRADKRIIEASERSHQIMAQQNRGWRLPWQKQEGDF
jgi:Asp-tRNA(Asn)/Glu-tRNA(Gln) amidotransferase C subunit